MQRVGENYKKIRNTFRYVLSNLYDFDPTKDAIPFDQMEELDQYMLRETAAFAGGVRKWYDEFAFHRIYQRVNHFAIVDLSAFYFDVLKDRLYISAPKSEARRSAQTAIWRIGEALARLLAPILTFTAEEIWQYLPKLESREESVHLAHFPATTDVLGNQFDGLAKGSETRNAKSGASLSHTSAHTQAIAAPWKGTASAVPSGALPNGALAPEVTQNWTTLRSVRDEVLKALEEARNNKLIGTGLEAQVILTAAEPLHALLKRYESQLRYLFIVSKVETRLAASPDGAPPAVKVEVKKADGQKCERCWNYSIHVGEDKLYPTVCERCSAVLKQLV